MHLQCLFFRLIFRLFFLFLMHLAVDRRPSGCGYVLRCICSVWICSLKNLDPSGLLLAVFQAASRLHASRSAAIAASSASSSASRVIFCTPISVSPIPPHTLLIAGQNHLPLLHFPYLALRFLRILPKTGWRRRQLQLFLQTADTPSPSSDCRSNGPTCFSSSDKISVDADQVLLFHLPASSGQWPCAA